MKAIIMAGGEGTRLRPVSVNAPKPMVRLFDRPVLAHMLELLKKNEIDQACLTLRFMPGAITGHFGDGGAFGMRLTHKIEETPLGTAGGVAACRDFIGDEDVLIVSGDAVCDFDLRACIDFHRERGADATIVLYAHPEPLEYGLVMTDEEGRIERFIEKPPWNQVFTNRINTGIYILSPRVLDEIPPGESYDFGKDLFPKLLEKGMRLYGVEAEGYWCDIGSPDAYLQSAMDALDKKLDLDLGTARRGMGIWAHSPLPPEAEVIPPIYVGRNTVIEAGAKLGPHAVIGENSHISAGASVERSMVDGANLGPGVRLFGAIVGPGASLRRDTVLHEGAVIGGGTILGEGTVVDARVRVWPDKHLPAGSRVSENLVGGRPRSGLRFSGGGAIRGEFGIDITPEALFAVGSALGREGRVGLGFSGGAAGMLSARAISCGVSAAGGQALEVDGAFPAVMSYAADLYGLDRAVFLRQRENWIELRFFGPGGLPVTREQERKVESALAAGDFYRADVTRTGDIIPTAGTLEAYVSAAAAWGDLTTRDPGISLEARGSGGANRALRRALAQMGCTVEDHGRELAAFETAHGGMVLRAEDEEGRILEPERLMSILVMLEFEQGTRAVAVPYAAPVTLDLLAEQYGASVLRLGRDPGAEALYYRQPYLRDGVFAATRLAGMMAKTGESLQGLAARAPEFHTAHREIPITGDKAAVMRELAGSLAETSAELFEGLRVSTGRGWVHVSPSAGRPVLKIHGESADMEAAEEICFEFQQRAREIDSRRDHPLAPTPLHTQ